MAELAPQTMCPGVGTAVDHHRRPNPGAQGQQQIVAAGASEQTLGQCGGADIMQDGDAQLQALTQQFGGT